jgi:ADP-L-glycero-D-manno-heptose 6-epimerase
MIIVTGAAGFIGSNLVSLLNENGSDNIILVDAFENDLKKQNLQNKKFIDKINRDVFFHWLEKNAKDVEFIFHIGARTDTTEFNKHIFDELNVEYSKKIWENCIKFNIPLIYASSAATYGLGEFGYTDSHEIVEQLKPLNPYGESKNDFDKWVLKQQKTPPFWYGVKFFNVYGPNEYHKGRMASVIFHAFHQIGKYNMMKLFRSHNPLFSDGEQKRDFIWVKDVTHILLYLMDYKINSGLYNIGTGKARTFIDLTRCTFSSMGIAEKIEFIDTPADIRDKYQYFTEAKMDKLIATGYNKPFTALEDGVMEYVTDYLMKTRYN